MNCRQCESLLALYVEDDLSARDAQRVEQHLAACEACRAFLADLRDSQEAVRGLRREPIDDAALARVRRAVLANAPALSTPRRAFTALATAMPVLAILLFGLWHQATKPPDLIAPDSGTIQTAKTEEITVHHQPQPEKHYAPTKPMTIKLVSDNPKVVIYWLVDGNEENSNDPTA